MAITKKKIIVPVVALMLCVCAIAGVAYAATSMTTKVTNTGNTADTAEFSIDINYATDPKSAQFTATTDVIVVSEIVDGEAAWNVPEQTINMGSAKTITLNAPKLDTDKTYKVMAYYVEEEAGDLEVSFKVGATAIGIASAGTQIGQITIAAGSTTGNLANVQVSASITAADVDNSDVEFGTYKFVFFVTESF